MNQIYTIYIKTDLDFFWSVQYLLLSKGYHLNLNENNKIPTWIKISLITNNVQVVYKLPKTINKSILIAKSINEVFKYLLLLPCHQCTNKKIESVFGMIVNTFGSINEKFSEI